MPEVEVSSEIEIQDNKNKGKRNDKNEYKGLERQHNFGPKQ